MKRKEEAEKRAKMEAEHEMMLKEAKWVQREKEYQWFFTSLISFVTSFSLTKKRGVALDEGKYIFSRRTGRRSFGNFNPYIEVFLLYFLICNSPLAVSLQTAIERREGRAEWNQDTCTC